MKTLIKNRFFGAGNYNIQISFLQDSNSLLDNCSIPIDAITIFFIQTDLTHKDSKQIQTMLLQNNSSRESLATIYVLSV